jgi:branched-chain amino acid transport system substrate-binding protein
MLHFPTVTLNLAPRPLGGPLRKTLVVAAALALAACSRPTGPITVGLAGPFSQPRGASMLRAAQLAVNQINAKRGIRGRKLELRVVDDSGNEDTAVRVAEQLYADPAIVAVVGHLSSGTSLAAARVYGGGATPTAMISPSASSPDLSGISPYVFRVCPSDLQHGPQLARFAWQTLGARRAGIIYINNDYGRGVRGTFATEFARLGGTVLEADPYIPATASLEPYLSRMRRGGADVLLLAAERPGAELVLREMRSLGLRWPVLGGDALTGIEADGALAEGIRLSSAYLADRRDDRNVAFVADYARAFPGQRPDHRGAGAYDIVLLLARAMDQAGADRRAVRDYLARVGRGQPPFEGVTGTIAFDGNGDVAGKTVVIGVVRNGRLVTEVAR